MSIFQKVRVITLGNLHELLDKEIDMNSVPVLKQYVRDLETGMAQLKSEAAIQAGGIRTLNREIGDMEHDIAAKTASIQVRLKQPGVTTDDPLVRSLAGQVTNLQKELEQKKTVELPEKQKVSTSLDAAVAKLETKHSAMVSNVRRLSSMDATAKAQHTAVTALEQADSLTSGISTDSIDNLAQKIQAKSDIEQEKFDRAMSSDSFAESDEQKADVDNFLATLKTA